MDRRHPGPLFWMVTWRSDIYLCPEAQHSVGTLLNPCPKGFCGISVVFRQWASSLHTWNCTQRNRETRAWLIYHTIFIMRYSPIILLPSVRSAEVLHVFSNYSRWEVFFHLVLLPGGEKVQPAMWDSLVCLGCSAELNGITCWRNAFFSENHEIFPLKYTPFFPNMDIQADMLVRTQKAKLRAWNMSKSH